MAINKTTVQVAVEACINMPQAYDRETMRTVLRSGISAGISPFYTDQLREILYPSTTERYREGTSDVPYLD